MPELSSSSVEVRFIDREAVIEDLRRAAAQARAARPEIGRVLLFGSLVRGNWTADSDADLIVVVDQEFSDFPERSRYQLHSKPIPTDTLVYSRAEFDELVRAPGSFLAQNLPFTIELSLARREGSAKSPDCRAPEQYSSGDREGRNRAMEGR